MGLFYRTVPAMLALISRKSAAFHRYTTATTTPQLLEDILINNIGLSREEALKAARCRRSKPITKDFTPVLNYFRDLGLSEVQTKRILTARADLLLADLDKTLKPKVQALLDLGLAGPGLVSVLVGSVACLTRSLDSCIKPRIEFLRSLLGRDENVVLALKRCSFLLKIDAKQRLASQVPIFEELGFSNKNFRRLFLSNPRLALALTPERALEIGHRVENELGIPKKSAMFYYGFMVLCSSKESTIDLKKAVFRSFGWSDSEMARLFTKFPDLMTYSEAKLRRNLGFFMGELGYSVDFLVSHHSLLIVGMETRVKPRYEVLKVLDSKKLRKTTPSFCAVVYLSEKKFVAQFLEPFKYQIPDVYESYVNRSRR